MRCAMTDQEYPDYSDGVWDDGEWISWDWINGQLHEQELRNEYPHASTPIIDVFHQLIEAAVQYKELTGTYLQIWGELGELYAEIKFGLKRHRPHTAGSDGMIDEHFVEVKTISPEKTTRKVIVKRAGNFTKLLVVKIDEHFEFQACLIDRNALGQGTGKNARFSWKPIDDVR